MILYEYLASEFRAMRGDGTVDGLPAKRTNLEPCRTSGEAVEAFQARQQAGIDQPFKAEAACIIQDVSVLVLCVVALIIFSAVAIGGQF